MVNDRKRTVMTSDEKYMKAAIREAKKAYALEEVPIGCVIVQNNKIIARGYNRRNTDKNTLAHAELAAIKKASKKTGDWRLEDCTMYVTLEPCPMCAGTIVMSGLDEVIFGAYDREAGCAGSVYNLPEDGAFMHPVPCSGGLLEKECADIIAGFFERRRSEKDL